VNARYLKVGIFTLPRWMLGCLYVLLLLCNKGYTENLLSNPNFELDVSRNEHEKKGAHVREDVLPDSWNYDGWNLNRQYSFFTFEMASHQNNKRQLHIHHDTPGHSYVWQAFELAADTRYHFSARVKVLRADASTVAAALGVIGKYSSANSVVKTESWQMLNYYINNAEEAKNVKLALSFGHYSNLNKGEVIFSDVSMKKIEKIPEVLRSGSASLIYGKPKYVVPEYYLC